MQNYSEANKQRIKDLNTRMRDMVREVADVLMAEENVSRAEAEASIGFDLEATRTVLRKRKSPYNAFTENLAAKKRDNPTSGVQSQGLGPFQKEASELYQALGPEEKAALVKDWQPGSNLTPEQKEFKHLKGVTAFKKYLKSYNAVCGSNFLLISVIDRTDKVETSDPTHSTSLFAVGEHGESLKAELGAKIKACVDSRFAASKEPKKYKYSTTGNILRKKYSQELLELYHTYPGMESAEVFPFQKFEKGIAVMLMHGWPNNVLIRSASRQTFASMHAVLKAIRAGNISFAASGREAVDTTPETRETFPLAVAKQ